MDEITKERVARRALILRKGQQIINQLKSIKKKALESSRKARRWNLGQGVGHMV